MKIISHNAAGTALIADNITNFAYGKIMSDALNASDQPNIWFQLVSDSYPLEPKKEPDT